jgi:DNA repair exonuclease SbcCD nuclease subunit
MKLLCYADLQATDGSELCYTQPNLTLQHYRVARFFSDLVRLYEQFQCDGLVDCGDTTDDRSAIPMPTLKCIGEGLAKIGNFEGRNYKLTGNHEQYQRDTTVDNRWLFHHHFRVVSDRLVCNLGETRAYFCAYPKDHAELAAWIKRESDKVRARKILFGHFQVKGAFLNNAKTSSGVPLEVLSGFDLVILGHIHQAQSLSKRIHYVGSPFQQDWGEVGQGKRLLLVDTESLSVANIPLSGYPEYRLVTLDEFKVAAQQQSEDRYRVVLKSHAETEDFFNHPGFHRAVAQYDYDTAEPEEAQEESSKDWSFDGILRRYMQQVPPAGAAITLSEDEMLALGKSIAEEA